MAAKKPSQAAPAKTPTKLINDIQRRPPTPKPAPVTHKPVPKKRVAQRPVAPHVDKVTIPRAETPEPSATPEPATAPQARRFRFSKKAVVAGVVIVAAAGIFATNQLTSQQNVAKTSESSDSANNVVENLKSRTVLPEGKTVNELGGWKVLTPPESDPLLAYVDTIGNTPVQVTQQSLPTPAEGTTESQIAELAQKFNATTEIDAGDTKAYIGTSAQGPQSVIFTKNSLLIMIKTEEKISDQAWINYIQSLS